MPDTVQLLARGGDLSPGAAPAPGLVARLRQQTSAEHAALEAAVPLTAESVASADYVRFLTLVGAFHARVEEELGGVEGLGEVIADLLERRKTGLLEADFAALGLDCAALAAAPESSRGGCPIAPDQHARVPALVSVSQAVGVLYVLEGSTLGSQRLCRHLSVALPELTARASRFLRCYGSRTGQMWSSFRSQVERAAPALDAEVVVNSAREAFVVLLDWFRGTSDGRAPGSVASRDPAEGEPVSQRVA